MRAIIFLLSFFLNLSAFAQARLGIDNPAPRAGDDIRVTFALDKQAGGSREPDKSLSSRDAASKNHAGFGDIKITTTLADTGNMVIGPFRFTVQNKEYTTDVLTIKVYPPLPPSVKDGVWIRQVDFNGDHFLIIEQRVGSKRKKEQKPDAEITIGFTDDPEFVSLDEEKFETNGLDIISSSSRSGNLTLDGTDVNFKVATFKFKMTASFKGKLKVDKKFLRDVPDNITIESILIK
jgi:hypothetical protein